MEITEVKFTASYPDYRQCPKGLTPEYAFIGRSNVGKSSLINSLTGRKGLAKVSGTPGKTQLINFFIVEKSWYLVDLPGYGYAKLSKKKRREFEQMIDQYLQRREMLQCTFVLVDLRLTPQSNDLEFINWLGANQIPFAIAFTKSDKLKTSEISRNLQTFKNKMLETWEEMPQYFITSAEKNLGREEILKFIGNVNKQFHDYIEAEGLKK